jgi:hypothetical protein
MGRGDRLRAIRHRKIGRIAMSFSRNLFLGAAAAGALLLPSAAFADVHSEIVNAAEHAGYAAAAADIAGVHAHLHHALNCLVGPGGNGFDAKEINPCAHAGNGIIPDTSDAAKKAGFEADADKARAGLADGNLASAQKTAADLAATLKKGE